jgi:hypothetical protein
MYVCMYTVCIRYVYGMYVYGMYVYGMYVYGMYTVCIRYVYGMYTVCIWYVGMYHGTTWSDASPAVTNCIVLTVKRINIKSITMCMHTMNAHVQ